MTTHDSDIPYYHTNTEENIEKSYKLAQKLLDAYGVLIENRYDENFVSESNPQGLSSMRELQWEEPELQREYVLEQFADHSLLTYGSHIMFTTIEKIGDEEQAYMDIFMCQTDDNGKRTYTKQQKTLQLTKANQKKEDEWWEKNRKTNDGKVWFAIRPDTVDEIAYQFELTLYSLERAEAILLGRAI